jgi:hypothetical protein
MAKDKVYVEQIVIVTDEGENGTPTFRDAWVDYAKEMQVNPSVIVVRVGGSNPAFVKGLTERGIEVSTFDIKGSDYYSLVNILPLLAMPTRADLVDKIMERELPQRPLAKAS